MDQLEITPSLSLPLGPLQLISEEDVVETVEDKSLLANPKYTLPSAQPNPFISRPKDVIFVERRGKTIVVDQPNSRHARDPVFSPL